MSAYFNYAEDFEIRADLPEAYRKAWALIAAPGHWWTAQEKVEILKETRAASACRFCAERKAALSPNAVSGVHDSASTLPEAAVDAVHRIVTDATRLTKRYVDELAASGISDGHYVELLGVVVAVISVDEFHRALSMPPEAPPLATSNDAPTRYRPPGAKAHGAWVDTIAPEDLSEPEADIYGGARATGNVISAMSLVPDSVRLLQWLGGAQYLEPHQVGNPSDNGGRALDRMQIELVASRVSNYNECFY